MATPSENKVDENEVTSKPHGRNRDDNDQELDLGFPLMRQSSIYSLTLDEIQNTVCEPGKGFGSMNMDEFISNIWSVEEAGFGAAADSADPSPANATDGGTGGGGAGGGPPLHRQGSLTVPAPLCRKTVDEVWAEIHKGQGGGVHHRGGGNEGNAQRQPTFGEMTLEDFLIKAGVVREGLGPASPHPPSAAPGPMQQSYGMPTSYPTGHGPEGAGFGLEYHHHHHQGRHPVVASEGGQHGKRYGNGYGSGLQQLRVGSPVSPVSSDGHVDNSGYGGNGGGGGGGGGMEVKMNGRKRVADGAVEVVVERRHRRMIKNRESAARSRARKQAYTVELEAELNQLKEENSRLREAERRAQALRKQMIAECMAENARANVEKARRSLRLCSSGPW